MHCFGVVLEKDLIAGIDLFLCEDAVSGEKTDALFINEVRHCIREGYEVCKTSAPGFFNPLFCVAVSVEQDPLVLNEHLAKELMDCMLHTCGVHITQPVKHIGQLIGNCGVQNDVRVCH